MSILTYHRVLPKHRIRREIVQPGMVVSDLSFDLQMRFLTGQFTVLSLPELLSMWSERQWDGDRRYCVVTFDDGWLDNYLYAYPILRRYNIPATIFLPTAFIGTSRWFWPDHLGFLLKHYAGISGSRPVHDRAASLSRHYSWLNDIAGPRALDAIDAAIERAKRLFEPEVDHLLDELSQTLAVRVPAQRVLLDWDEIREMSGHGISFGSHSVTHRILPRLDPRERELELTRSLDALRAARISSVPVFSYPNGNYTPEIAGEVRAAGYQAALSTRWGPEQAVPEDLFALRRIAVHDDIAATIPLFTFHLSLAARWGIATQ